MFKMVKTLTTWWPVKVYEPDPIKPGTFAEFSFEVEFEILDREELKKNQDARNAVLETAETDTSAKKLEEIQAALDAMEIKAFQRVVRNWRQVVDDNDQPLPFTNENFLEALKRDHIREGINVAYAEAIDSGKARLGN